MTQQTHYFIALSLPQPIREVLTGVKELVEPKLPFKTWVHPQDLHITLAFLGNPSSLSQMGAVKGKLKIVSAKHSSFTLELDGFGIFGKSDSPRILWSALKEQNYLLQLQKDIYQACTEIGFKLEDRPYKPHITLARKWMSKDPFEMETLKSMVQPKEEFSKFNAGHIVLYQTHINRLPKYQPLSIYPLEAK
ncbi:RNA 2',3'-cyclic phosphodiesterase [Cytobacillus suaedae]|nr:RNA 2',3'-cyclic phosphodiesterase [Cytobacillus suaedae]